MNWGKRILMIAGLMTVFASGLVGCNKSSGSNNVSGNVSLNGLSATGSDTVNGMPISLTISSGYYNNQQGNSSYTSATINGIPVTLPIYTPTAYMQNPQLGPSQLNLGGQFAALGLALCMDTMPAYYGCQNMAIIVWAQPGYMTGGVFSSAQMAMQMGIYKDAAGTIHSSIEKVGYPSTGYGSSYSPALSTATDLATWLVQNAK